MKLLDLPADLAERRQFGFWDDFLWYISPHLWTSLAADAGATVAIVAGGAGGKVALTTGATDNNEAAVKTTNEVFLFGDEKPLMAEANVQYTEANVDDANVAFGFADAFGADLLLDNGAGPKVSFSGALIFKVDGGTAWKVISSKGASQTISTSTKTPGGATAQTLRIEARMLDASTAEVTFWVDGQQLLDSQTSKPIKHTLTITSAVAMACGAYVKAGGANSEVLNVDYLGSWQLR